MIIQNLIAHIKSKRPEDWTGRELEEFVYAIRYMYQYSSSITERDTLRPLHDKIVGMVNKNPKFCIGMNPGHLINLDKEYPIRTK